MVQVESTNALVSFGSWKAIWQALFAEQQACLARVGETALCQTLNQPHVLCPLSRKRCSWRQRARQNTKKHMCYSPPPMHPPVSFDLPQKCVCWSRGLCSAWFNEACTWSCLMEALVFSRLMTLATERCRRPTDWSWSGCASELLEDAGVMPAQGGEGMRR